MSTCYVAGNRRGAAPEIRVDESPFWNDIDWRREVEGARRVRADAEAESRTPARLAEVAAAARHELGAAGTPLLAAKTEQRRKDWVKDQLVDAGRARAASLGWPDAYAMTKALGEKALGENRGDVPVSIVRPAIIESAWSEPVPGWIRGFRMAEPVIISYARGLLSEFPGVPEGTVDVIPVDLVVGAICAVAARGPANEDGSPDVTQVASGSAQPAQVRATRRPGAGLVRRAPALRQRGPADQRARLGLHVPRAGAGAARHAARSCWSGPSARSSRCPCGARRRRGRPRSRRSASWPSGRSPTSSSTAPTPRARRSTAWTGCSPCRRRSTPQDQAEFNMDPRVIDWDHYVHEIHLPSVVKHARVRTDGSKGAGESRSTRLRRQVLSPDRQLAAFDLENTLIASNVVTSYAWLASPAPGPRRPAPPHHQAARRGAVAAASWTVPTAATSSATSTGATSTPPRSGCERTRPRCSPS